MTNLHYAELAARNPDLRTTVPKLMEQAFYELRPFYTYLSQAQRWLISQTLELGWTEADEPRRFELLGPIQDPSENHAGGVLRENRVPTWIRLVEAEIGASEEAIDAFLEAPWLADRKGTRPNLRVLARNEEEGVLLLSQAPSGKALYLIPDTTTIRRQLTALFRLQNTPLPEHRPLLRLVESRSSVTWPDIRPEKVGEWFLLRNEEFPGNDEQRKFVELALGTPDFAILAGPPGSGKTVTICEYILQELERGHRVLLCASTHVAVDNVLEKLVERGWTDSKVIPVRIGDEGRVSELAKPFLLGFRLEEERKRLRAALERIPTRTRSQNQLLQDLKDNPNEVLVPMVLESANLTCGTTLGILKHPDLRGWDDLHRAGLPVPPPAYDVLVVDECSKTTFSEFLVPALLARKWILVGDTKQLSPYVEEGFLQANLDGIVPPEDGALCAPLLDVRPGRHGVIVAPPTESGKDLTLRQAVGLGLQAHIFDKEPSGTPDLEPLEAWGCDVAIMAPHHVRAWEDFLPPDLLNHTHIALPTHDRRRRAWLGREGHTPDQSLRAPDSPEAETWAYEVAWRMVRVFELRKSPDLSEAYREAIDLLVPRWYPVRGAIDSGDSTDTPRGRTQEGVRRSINSVQRAAFPSVLELLQEGLPRVDFTKPLPIEAARNGSSILLGLPPQAFAQRSMALSYQHRMHPEISRIPREQVYGSALLKDPPYLEGARQWDFGRYASRACWISVRARAHTAGNVNPEEVQTILTELRAFRAWARTNPPPKVRGEKATWQVAVLTFYRPQETAIRYALQEMFHGRQRQRFIDEACHLEIRLGTVDRFQGQEADLVLLSFVRNHGVGFLDNPNRLNVALTRARYQLVLIGHQWHFARTRRSDFLRVVATQLGGAIDLRAGGT